MTTHPNFFPFFFSPPFLFHLLSLYDRVSVAGRNKKLIAVRPLSKIARGITFFKRCAD